MTNVLVAYASKMGGTRGIATAISEQLTLAGADVHLVSAADTVTLGGYDAAVVGSALYTGRWRPAAVNLLVRHAKAGTAIPVWLFQSGPCGPDATHQLPAPRRVQKLAATIGAAAPTTFGGRLEPATARGFLGRRLASGPMAGDFRDFDQIRRWADGIAVQLALPATSRK
jgi:menaquinone-dependent protoporphyrinogen oxidase